MIGDVEVWRMVRIAEREAMQYDRSLQARLAHASASQKPGLLRRFLTRVRPADKPAQAATEIPVARPRATSGTAAPRRDAIRP